MGGLLLERFQLRKRALTMTLVIAMQDSLEVEIENMTSEYRSLLLDARPIYNFAESMKIATNA